MSLLYKIPHQARFLQTANIFTAEFNKVNGVPTGSGLYDFAQTVNDNQTVIPLQSNTIYFLERINIGGTIAEAEYLNAMNVLPLASFKRSQQKQIIYQRPLPIVNYIDNQEINAWFLSDKSSDELVITFTGQLTQTSALVGITFVTIHVGLNIYAIESAHFVANFRNDLFPSVGRNLRE